MPVLTPAEIRAYIKDQRDLNILLEGELQNNDSLINLAGTMAIDEFNQISYVTNYTAENFPSTHIYLYGVLYYLARAEAERQLRNNVTYSAQGVNAGIDDKYQFYMQLAEFYYQRFMQVANEFKAKLALKNSWGETHSPYVNVLFGQFRS